MSLPQRIKSYFDAAVAMDYDGPSKAHPIIVLNALKNIIGDNRNNPSQKLLDSMANKSEIYPQRTDDQKVLDRVAKDGLGQTVFISDLEDACQSGNSLRMEIEAARINCVSENGLGGLEVLSEVALQDYDRFGIFVYHLQRSNVFQRDKENTWPYTRCLLKEIAKSSLPEPHEKMDQRSEIMGQVPTDSSELSQIAAARRLWEGDYVRINGYRRELSHWFSKLNVEGEKMINKKTVDVLLDYVQNGGNYFIELAENLIKTTGWEAKIIQLEALRFYAKNASLKDLPTILSHLEVIIS